MLVKAIFGTSYIDYNPICTLPQVGMLLFDSCGAQGDQSCMKDSAAMCACEKKAGRVMCSELEYAWSTLCPNTKSLAMHKVSCLSTVRFAACPVV